MCGQFVCREDIVVGFFQIDKFLEPPLVGSYSPYGLYVFLCGQHVWDIIIHSPN